MTKPAIKIFLIVILLIAAGAVYWFVIKEDSEKTPSPGGVTPSPSGGSITDYEDYISNITFDWATEYTIGIINNNSYAPTPTELYENEVNEATRILLNRSVYDFDIIQRDTSKSKYGNYCKLKVGMMNTHGISMESSVECGDEIAAVSN